MQGRQAKESETILRNKFQIPLPTEDAYNEWRVGMEDPTEESRKLCDLSELLYEVEQEPPLDPHQPESEDVYKFNLVCGRIAEYCSNFVRMPTPPGFMVQCQITRSRQGINGLLYPTYFMHLENKNGVPGVMILTAVRSNLVKTDYVISTNPAEMSPKSEFCAGILQTNLWGSDCVLKVPVKSEKNGETCDEQKKEWEQLMSLKFESNALGIKGPRKLSVAIPKLKSDWEQCHPGSFTFPPNDEDTEQVAIVKNRAPRWSEDTCTYVLNFSSRVQRSSVKNFQLEYQIKGSDFTLLQFGRCNRSKNFILDFSYPFCPLQAFAIALTSFDVKWGLD
ncbi:Tubby protein [Folsomia candida]|uniref:Tubby protein n=1 Tax=Folsomia candida TaxID=158441 RepID=A0A226E2E8_FOLCA|nr:Tubby protein [Folsomia candida]